MRRVAFLVVLLLATRAHAQTTVDVDANANRHPIDARVYGVAFGDQTTLSDLNVPLNRSGGNPTSRYNWQQNCDNRAADYFFESIGYQSATPGENADSFIAGSKGANADAMITIPTLGWVAKLGANRAKLASFSVAKYGSQQRTDPYFADAGDGVKASGANVTGNDPNDASVPADSTFQRAWVQHLVTKWGLAANGGLRYYLMDNEPSIWFGTHRDVAPTGATMAQIRDKILDYGAMVKSVDPNAIVLGPEEWGWSGYLYSGYDQQYGAAHGYSSFPDRAANGGMDYLPWLLDQLHKAEQASGVRVLDVFTVHYYPQGGEFGNDTSTTMQLLRNKSTRSLWDPSYTDQSWIADKVQLIPRLKQWVKTYYPGTQIGLTEYNWGAEGHMNGATAQADVLGILGREGLDLAARWTCPDKTTPTYKAIQLYRNYDGQKSVFGEESVGATVANPDNLAAFAALRASDGALTVMVVNKILTGGMAPVTINVANFKAKGPVHVYQLTAANVIDHLPDLAVSGTSVQASVPAQSITLFVVEGMASVAVPPPPSGGVVSAPPAPTTSTTATTPTTPTGGSATTTTAPASRSAASSGSGGAGGCEVAASGRPASGVAPLAVLLALLAVRRRRAQAGG